jgi:hypothetical protein
MSDDNDLHYNQVPNCIQKKSIYRRMIPGGRQPVPFKKVALEHPGSDGCSLQDPLMNYFL